jgi:hypothetical protein
MAFAWPLARHDFGAGARSLLTRGAWLRAVLPAALVCAGALLLAPPWRKALPEAAPEKPVAAPASPLLPAGADPSALVGALLVVGGALALLPAILSRLQSSKRRTDRPRRGAAARRAAQSMLVQVGGRRILVGASSARPRSGSTRAVVRRGRPHRAGRRRRARMKALAGLLIGVLVAAGRCRRSRRRRARPPAIRPRLQDRSASPALRKSPCRRRRCSSS